MVGVRPQAGGPARPGPPPWVVPRRSRLRRAALVAIAAAVGCAGGIYGVGGGSILAPVLIGDGHPPARAAPATLTTRPRARVQETGRRIGAHGSSVTRHPVSRRSPRCAGRTGR